MQSIQTLPTSKTESHPIAAQIPKLSHKEAGQLAETELARFISLVESLAGEDWDQPTMCTKWNVRDILAHQAGAYASGASFAEFRHQGMRNPYAKEEKMLIDAINRLQLEDREGRSPEKLLGELRAAGPQAIANRQKLPGLLRAIPLIDFGPPVGRTPLGYLTDNIMTRDTWMHRYDICVATGREMVLTAEHDGRITALVIRDLENILRPIINSCAFVLDLKGPGGGIWQFGDKTPSTKISMEALDFHIFASDRATAEEVIETGKVIFDGDTAFAKKVFEHISVPY
ncbi:MAG: maleylpyruvate isomerase family mycothiol-dependent enzyme [Candidatus Promineifilaceae bacterium]|nr:maleylpyruvate isomerase family mycothiol-dependent enzyme [Candidatus Promineifilaceae bacterium]